MPDICVLGIQPCPPCFYLCPNSLAFCYSRRSFLLLTHLFTIGKVGAKSDGRSRCKTRRNRDALRVYLPSSSPPRALAVPSATTTLKRSLPMGCSTGHGDRKPRATKGCNQFELLIRLLGATVHHHGYNTAVQLLSS